MNRKYNALSPLIIKELYCCYKYFFLLQLDLGYLATSYPDISIIRPRSCSVNYFSLISIQNFTQNKK